MGQLDKMIKKAEEAQERRSQQQSGEATVSPPPVENQEHEDVPATVVITQTQPTQGKPEPEAIPNSPSWWKRVRDRFSSGGRVRRPDVSAEAAEKPVEPTSPTEGSVSPMTSERLQACNDMVGIRQEIAAYETAINTNDRIIKDIQKLYDDDKEYIRDVTDMTKDVDHHRLATTNQLAKANIEVLARNLYALPSVSHMADKDIIKAQEAMRAEKVAQVDEATAEAEKTPQEAKEEAKPTPISTPKPETKPQTASPVSGNGLMPILKDVALAILFFAVVALGASYFTSDGQSYSPDAQSAIDSLQAVIDSQSKELSEKRKGNKDYNLLRWKYDRMAKIKAREEAQAIFDYSDYNRLILEYDRLRKEYANLEVKAIDYAKAYKELKTTMGTSGSGKAKEDRAEPQEPSHGKSVFNSIESHEERSPHSPQSY